MPEKRKTEPISQRFGVLTQPAGSYTLGEHHFAAGEVTAVAEAVEALACPETSPVAFFASKEEAEAMLQQIAAQKR